MGEKYNVFFNFKMFVFKKKIEGSFYMDFLKIYDYFEGIPKP